METLLEEIALVAAGGTAGSGGAAGGLTPAGVDAAVAQCADLWGLLQPYSHLNAGRVASGNQTFFSSLSLLTLYFSAESEEQTPRFSMPYGYGGLV